MPRRDGTGPIGAGAMTGRGLGLCTGANAVKCGAGIGMGLGLGLACKRGLNRGCGRKGRRNQDALQPQKEFLEKQKLMLQARLEEIEKQLGTL